MKDIHQISSCICDRFCCLQGNIDLVIRRHLDSHSIYQIDSFVMLLITSKNWINDQIAYFVVWRRVAEINLKFMTSIDICIYIYFSLYSYINIVKHEIWHRSLRRNSSFLFRRRFHILNRRTDHLVQFFRSFIFFDRDRKVFP